MSTDSVNEIMADMRLSEADRQDKLQNAFRFWGMQKDLELAKAGQWKEVWDRQQQRTQDYTANQLKIAQAARDFAAARKYNEDAAIGSMPGQAGAIYKTLVEQYMQEHPDLGGDVSKIPPTDKLKLQEQAAQIGRTAEKPLNPTQQQKNDEITAAQRRLGILPTSFDELLRNTINGSKQYRDSDLTAQGFSPTQIALFRALAKQTGGFEMTNSEKELVKDYETSRLPLLRPSKVLLTDQGAATNNATGLDDLIEDAQSALDQGYSRDDVKALFIQKGGTAAQFDENFPVSTSGLTTTPAAAARPGRTPVRTNPWDALGLGMSIQPGP